MDRFIATYRAKSCYQKSVLKSNMDRFIGVRTEICNACFLRFKIQYGQIYRPRACKIVSTSPFFKIQYGQIYSQPDFDYSKTILNFKIQYGQIYSDGENMQYYSVKNFKIQYGQIYSNVYLNQLLYICLLKSNMDRFIAVRPPRQEHQL